MDTLKKFISWGQAIASAFFVISSTNIYSWLKTKQFDGYKSTVLVFVFVVLGLKLTETLIKWALNNSRKIRSFVYGRYNIEGHWFDLVLHIPTKTVREYGLIEIQFEEGEFVASGILFDCNLRRIGDFCSHLAKFNGSKLEYGYSRRAEHKNLEVASGLGEYIFTKERPYPLTFSGNFFDPALDKKVTVKGIRIIDKKLIHRITTKDSNDQVKLVEELSKIFYKEFPEYQTGRTEKGSCSI